MLQIHHSPAEFISLMEPHLLQRKAKYGLMLGLALQLTTPQDVYTEPPFLATVSEKSEIHAAAMMTPPFGVILYSEHPQYKSGLEQIAKVLAKEGWPIPTANGPSHLSSTFAEIWSNQTGVTATLSMHQRVFELRAVQEITPSHGQLRLALPDDIELLMEWIADFHTETFGDIEPARSIEDQTRITLRRIADEMLYLWEDGQPVSFVGVARPTDRGISIGPVYTPPEHRGRGYATSAVAQVSQQMLDAGKEFCTLFTDLANPTSNHIYENIGYRPVTDYTLYKFSDTKA